MAGPEERAAIAETHCAVVVFVGDRAYKLKKPVDLGFLDFRTVGARRQACEREVVLNRRLAPDVYLGVVDVTGPDGQLCDSAVVMRRMPASRRLSTLVRSGVDVRDGLRALAEQLAAFHAGARHDQQTAAEGSRDAVRERWQASFEQTRPFRGGVLDEAETAEVERLALRYLAAREPLFFARAAAGLVRDGHGDLLADDVFLLPDGPRALDCLEFDDRLRYVDGLDDATFLAMDLERLGAPSLGRSFLDWYAQFSGTPRVASLEHHYVAYRAFVRAKVACLRAAQGDPAAQLEARACVRIALHHLRAAQVRLVLVGGLPGVGKSTVASALADRMPATLFRTDVIRNEFAFLGVDEPGPVRYRTGLYEPEVTEATYRALLDDARAALERGESVVLDASWADATLRQRAVELAEATRADLIQLHCVAPAPVAERRLRERVADVSDADPAIAAAMAADFAPWPSAIAVDTAGTVEATVAAAYTVVARDLRPWPAPAVA
jgi:aminoglycoside phosphotransferase family enzyme/predicted kinase